MGRQTEIQHIHTHSDLILPGRRIEMKMFPICSLLLMVLAFTTAVPVPGPDLDALSDNYNRGFGKAAEGPIEQSTDDVNSEKSDRSIKHKHKVYLRLSYPTPRPSKSDTGIPSNYGKSNTGMSAVARLKNYLNV